MANNKAFKVKNGLELEAYAKSITDTAVDVFVYDTRKDSDGGAWRKRTQHTSWYNETLNTSTRGSRKEFPAVAVIVAESDQVTIYDGDDPDLPMWMVFDHGTRNFLPNYISAGDITSVIAINGDIYAGDTSNGIIFIRFFSDAAGFYGEAYKVDWNRPIVDRNANTTTETLDLSVNIVNRAVNDVAMTVLPDAPTDPATGLPVPTIAVATAGGVSVIKDDGTVVDHTNGAGYDTAYQVSFLDDYRYVAKFNESTSASNAGVFVVENFTTSSPTFNLYNSRNTYNNSYGPSVTTNVGSTGGVSKNLPAIYTSEKEFAVAGDRFLAQVSEGNTLPSGMVAYTASSYNTGWMNGDIKLATLSDTDDTDVTGSELVTNGTFDTDISGWTGNANATLSLQTNELRVENSSADLGEAYQAIVLDAGTTYTFSADITAINVSHAQFYLSTTTTGTSGTVAGAQYNTTGVKSFTYTPSSSGTYYIVIGHRGSNTAGYYAQYDDISARKSEADRSVNGNGLQVFGTVTKSAVASGADLVAYSGFSATNYLEMPYNSDLDFGTGDFCMMGWVKTTDGYGQIMYRADADFSPSYSMYITAGDIAFSTYDGSSSHITGREVTNDQWTHFVGVRHPSGLMELYVNGVLDTSSTLTVRNMNSVDGAATLKIGQAANNPLTGSLALLRISATAPTAEQIKKIYEDEKVLFQENAACTLYGASDAVTALAHDSDTGLLHVGTSAGRSVFQGLRRVSNTTTAVGTAISASNSLVVEE